MGNVYEEISRLKTAKSDIESAIEFCGVNVPDTELIDNYSTYVRRIPLAIFSDLNVPESGGGYQYIKSIKQENGLIVTTTGGIVSTSSSGLAPQIVTTDAETIATLTSELVLTSDGSTSVWKKLPTNAFFNNQVTLTAKSDNVTYPILLGPSNHTSGTTSGVYYDTGVTLNPSTNTLTTNITGSAVNLAGGTAGSIPYQTAADTTAFLALGSNGEVLKIVNGALAWAADSNSNTWRAILVNGTLIASTSTGTGAYALNFISGTGITPIGTSGTDSTVNTIAFDLNASKTDTLGGIKVAKVETSAVTLSSDGTKYYGVNIDSNNKAYVALPTSITRNGTVTSVTLKPGNGISISSTAAITTIGSRTITNTGVIATTINGDYLQVNTGGTTTDLTIPFATKAACLTTSLDTIKTTTDDTTSKWGVLGNSVHMYSEKNLLNNQPSLYGLLLNLAYGADVHLIWTTLSTGNLYHRGGNGTGGWVNNSNWITILDSANSSISGDGGSTWGSSITVKINNVEKTLTIPSNPNTDDKVKLTANATSTYRPVILGYTSNSSAAFTNNLINLVYYSTKIYANPYSGALYLVGNGGLQVSGVITSTVTDGIAPLVINSTTVVENLNADMLDGFHASDFTVVGIINIARMRNLNGNTSEIMYTISGNAVANPSTFTSIQVPSLVELKFSIIEVISKSNSVTSCSFSGRILNFNLSIMPTTGDISTIKVLMGGS